MAYRAILIASADAALSDVLGTELETILVETEADCESAGVVRLAIIDMAHGSLDLERCRAVLGWGALRGVPVVAVARSVSLDDRLAALEFGLDDILDGTLSAADIEAQIMRHLFHKIADEQLGQRLSEAFSEPASDPAARLHSFWLAALEADDLSELGQLFFREIAHAGLDCSLQLRDFHATKDMEANGMSREVKSKLRSGWRSSVAEGSLSVRGG